MLRIGTDSWACSKCGFTPRPFDAVVVLEHIETCAGVPTAHMRAELARMDDFTRRRFERELPAMLADADQDIPEPHIHAVTRRFFSPWKVLACHADEGLTLEPLDLIMVAGQVHVIERIEPAEPGMLMILARDLH